jgi:molecular chaperone GrpE
MKPEHESNTAPQPGEAVAGVPSGPTGRVEVDVSQAADDVLDAVDAELDADEALSSPDAMRAEIELLKSLVAGERDEVLRVLAEMENLRKRSAREVENAHKFGLEKIIGELLPVRDSLELGLTASAAEGVEVASVREGLELTLKMLDTATGKFGLVEVNPEGDAFDPERHQAISMQDAPGVASGTILIVVQKGFTLNERLVRPAMVIVSS